MKLIFETITKSESETFELGKNIFKHIPKNTNLIILKGELGSGKTMFVKGIAKGLDINEDILSPTYGYKRKYKGLVHYDLYLLKKMKSKGLKSLITEDLEDNLVIIEWGERLPKIKNSIIILIKKISEFTRKIEISE